MTKRVNGRVHSSTDAVPADRLDVERSFLAPLPPHRFDTAYREPRRVHVAVPLIEWDAVRYSVPPECLGQMVGARVEVDSGVLEFTWGAQVVGAHRLVDAPHDDVWDPAHRRAAEAAALGRSAVPLRLVRGAPTPRPAERYGAFDVDAPDLVDRYGALGEMS